VTLSDFRAGHHPIDDVEGATFTGPGSPPITQITFLTCRAHYPGGPNRCLSVSFPARTAFPGQLAGRRPHPNFRGLLKLHSRYDLQDRSPPKADSCSEAPTRSVSRPSRSVATMLTDNYMGGSSSHWRSAPLGRTVDRLLFEPCTCGHDLWFARNPAVSGWAGRPSWTTLLFEISPVDPLTYSVVAIGLLGAAAVASYLPARRVTRVDPVEALRAEW